jgi:hypothetical protein
VVIGAAIVVYCGAYAGAAVVYVGEAVVYACVVGIVLYAAGAAMVVVMGRAPYVWVPIIAARFRLQL